MGNSGKVAERAMARELRSAGWTMPEIASHLGVARSSVSLWCRDVPYQPRRPRPAQPVHPFRIARLAQLEQVAVDAASAVGTLQPRDLMMYAVGLYHGEGAKTDRSLRIANTSPRVLVAFLTWLRSAFDIDESRLRVRVYLHEGLCLETAEEFWSARLAIPRPQFHRAHRPPAARSGDSKHPMGCATVIYSDALIHRRVMGLIEAVSSSFADPG